MSKFANSININEFDEDEKSGGYGVSELLNKTESMEGGAPNVFTDLQIPIGLYCNNNMVCDFYKVVNPSVIEDDLFDKLFDMVSKAKSKATRREHPNKHKITIKLGKR